MAQVEERFIRDAETVMIEPGSFIPMAHDESWVAQVRWLRVDGARADYLTVGPHRYEVPPFAERGGGVPMLMLVLVLEGSTSGTVDGHQVTLRRGNGALVDARAGLSFRAKGPMRAMRILIDEDHLPPEVLQTRTLPFAVLKDTPLVYGCIGLVSGLLQLQNKQVQQHDEIAVSQPLIALVTALLDEALHDETHQMQHSRPAPDRRTAINDYIDLHLTEPDLSPASIAAALQINLRTLHAAFEGSSDTAAAYIRRLRIQKAKALLTLRTEPPNIKAIAERVGLQPDPFTRAFKADTGLTARQWWERHHGEVIDPA